MKLMTYEIKCLTLLTFITVLFTLNTPKSTNSYVCCITTVAEKKKLPAFTNAKCSF